MNSFLVGLALLVFSSAQPVTPQERDALVALTSAFPALGTIYGWSFDHLSFPCGGSTFLPLPGVTCSGPNVTSLKFLASTHAISGYLPVQLGNLSNLQELILEGQIVSGTIPASIVQLTFTLISVQITPTNFQTCLKNPSGLTGSIPLTLFNATNLISVNLACNQLNGTLPKIGTAAPGLQVLNLRQNQLSGTIGKFTGFDRLSFMDLSGNLFSGGVTNEIGILPLNYLDLSNNLITTIGALDNASSTLTYFSFSNNNLILDPIPQWILKLQNLQTIRLCGLQTQGILPNFTRTLQVIDLSNNFYSTFPSFYFEYFSLRELDISSNSITGSIPDMFMPLQNLTALNLSNNDVFSTLPSTIGNLTQLQFLRLDNNSFYGSIPATYEALTGVGAFMNFSNNDIDCYLPPTIPNSYPKLEWDYKAVFPDCNGAATPTPGVTPTPTPTPGVTPTPTPSPIPSPIPTPVPSPVVIINGSVVINTTQPTNSSVVLLGNGTILTNWTINGNLILGNQTVIQSNATIIVNGCVTLQGNLNTTVPTGQAVLVYQCKDGVFATATDSNTQNLSCAESVLRPDYQQNALVFYSDVPTLLDSACGGFSTWIIGLIIGGVFVFLIFMIAAYLFVVKRDKVFPYAEV